MIPAESPLAGSNRVNPPNVGPDPAMLQAIGSLLTGDPSNQASDPYADDKALLKLFKQYHTLCFDQRWNYERTWWRNLLYTLNRQWIFYNQARGAWQDKRMQKWIPRPVTNKIAETVDAMRAVFLSVNLTAKCQPVSDDPQDRQTAETAENLDPVLFREHDMSFRLFESDFWSIETGNAFWHPYFDKRQEHGILLVPFEKCLNCQKAFEPSKVVEAGQKCPNCGGMMLEQARDQSGALVGSEFPVGRGATKIFSPFEIGFPSGYGSFNDVPGTICQQWRTKEYYERFCPELVGELKFEKTSSERSLQLLKALASQSDIAGTALGVQTGDTSSDEGITEYTLWLKPTKTYPEGLVCKFVGDKVLRSDDQSEAPGPLPMKTVKGQPIFPWIHVAFQRFGGRIWGRSPIDLIIQKQDQINQLDSLILLGVNRMANPVWIEPKGAEVKKFTGEPGLVVKYNPLVAGGNAKPERIEGANIPASLLKLREQYLMDLETLAGTQDVLKGARPAGVTAFSAMQLLVERAQSRFGPVLNERGEAYRQWFQLALEIERQFGPMERIWAAMGANRRWTFETFKNADIQGEIRVLIEDGSQAPKTNLGKRAAVEGLNNLGLIDASDPDQRRRIYEVFGQLDLLPSLNAAVQAALAEQAEFEQWAQSPGSQPLPTMPAPMAPNGGPAPTRAYFADEEPAPEPGAEPGMEPSAEMGPPGLPPPTPTLLPCPLQLKLWHRDDVHIAEHTKWANSDAARMLFRARPDVEAQFTYHLAEHQQRAALQMMQEQLAAAPMGAEPGKAAGAGRAMQNSNEQSGKRGANQAPPA